MKVTQRGTDKLRRYGHRAIGPIPEDRLLSLTSGPEEEEAGMLCRVVGLNMANPRQTSGGNDLYEAVNSRSCGISVGS